MADRSTNECEWQVWVPNRSSANGDYRFSKTVSAKYARSAAMEFLGVERRIAQTRLLVVPDDPAREAVVLNVNPTFQTERSC
jgi:hypothetical protein